MSINFVIRPILNEEAAEAKRLINSVVYDLKFFPDLSLDEINVLCEAEGFLDDIDNVQKNYISRKGMFLVMMDGARMLGTGAFCRYADGLCELKRLYILTEFQRQGLGYAMMRKLLRNAQIMNYARMCLWVNRIKQLRAIDFFHQVGFMNVPHLGAEEEELWMEMLI